jgi:hypothetical protein
VADIRETLALYRPSREMTRMLYNNRPALLYKRRYIHSYYYRDDTIDYEIFDYYKQRTISNYYYDRLFNEANYNNPILSYGYINGFVDIDYYICKNIRMEISYKSEYVTCTIFVNDIIRKIVTGDYDISDMILDRIIKKLM